ncbi:RNA polymerase sigma-70 factor (ECF subfamily) [Mucilaginibacter gracilis]|uniref:RNA polymerase sigma-70 factor (ECF subfamily) n=1 Tax=Mucilaginibacter gracilis TaxID=423350 RepID=A0A495J342_9SPHI|nr:sigma-70 family RNA polymerase sigma factor [Mucilaginibacter gracilis]RKR83395.1 RNA polymerase sigma-70 factor (ECF subfamily) [Mucilaginibacter gracilis]
MEHATDKELIRLIRLSDYAAFDELHHRYWASLRRLAYRKTGDRADAFDLVQEMYIELWEKRETLAFGDELNGWLHNRLWFKLSTYYRTKGFQEKHLENIRINLEADLSFPQHDVLELVENQKKYDRLLDVVNQTIEEMPDRMREIFLLNRNEQKNVSEISEKLGISPKTARKQLDRAMVRLRLSTQNYKASTMELLFIAWIIYS